AAGVAQGSVRAARRPGDPAGVRRDAQAGQPEGGAGQHRHAVVERAAAGAARVDGIDEIERGGAAGAEGGTGGVAAAAGGAGSTEVESRRAADRRADADAARYRLAAREDAREKERLA